MQRSKPTSKPSPNLPEIESINSLQNGLGLSHFNTFYRMVHPHHFDLWFSCSISYKVVCPPVKCWLLHVHPMNYRSSINPRYVMFHPLSYHEPVIKRFLGFVKFFPVMLMLIKYHRNPSYAYNLILRFLFKTSYVLVKITIFSGKKTRGPRPQNIQLRGRAGGARRCHEAVVVTGWWRWCEWS